MSEVELVGGPHRLVVQRTSPYYKSFFSSLEEATGSVPERIDVPQYVLEQYPAWQRLLAWMALGELVFYYSGYTNLLDSSVKTDELRMNAPLPVYLHEVNAFIGMLIDPPEDWLRFVAVDDRTNHADRMRHYKTVGRMVRRLEFPELAHGNNTWRDRLYKDFNMTKDPIMRTTLYSNRERTISDSDYERLLEVDWLNTLQGMRHNALLQLIGTSQDSRGYHPWEGESDWTLINWDDVMSLRVQWTVVPNLAVDNVKRVTPLVTYCYAGRRINKPIKLTNVSTSWLFTSFTSLGGITFTMRSTKRPDSPPIMPMTIHYGELYDRTLQALTYEEGHSVMDSVDFGLSVLLTKGKYRDINKKSGVFIIPKERAPHYHYQHNTTSLIPLIHLTVLLYVPRSRISIQEGYNDITLKESDFPATIDLIVKTLGTRALSVMVATLMQYNPEDEKAMHFCELAIEQLEQHGTSGRFIMLPDEDTAQNSERYTEENKWVAKYGPVRTIF